MASWENLSAGALVAERYVVLGPLASGGFGAVYVAEQLATERRVALKVLWPHILQNVRAREQFTLEARVASRINSENVVQVLDAGVDTQNDITYLVMELLHGQDLGKLVGQSGPPSPGDALEYLRQTAAGLDKAHRHIDRSGRAAPIIHRDLKPDNLFLTTREDGSPLVKILDFGIAKVLSESTQMSGDVKGTPLYMAYEQASRGPVGPATDVWAFGLIAFYLLSGKSYWKSANAHDGTMTQLFGEVLSLPLSPASLRAQELGLRFTFNSAFDGWFSRCVHRDPHQRYQSIAEAMKALFETDVAGVSVLPASAARHPLAPPVSYGRAQLNTASPAITVQGALTPSALHRTLPAEPATSAGAPGHRRKVLLLGGATVALSALGAAGLVWLRAHSPAFDEAAIVPSRAATSIALTVASSSPPSSAPLSASPAFSAASVASPPSAAAPAPSSSVTNAPRPVPKAKTAKQQPGAFEVDVYGDR